MRQKKIQIIVKQHFDSFFFVSQFNILKNNLIFTFTVHEKLIFSEQFLMISEILIIETLKRKLSTSILVSRNLMFAM